MKIVFFGTPDFAVASLKILLENGYEVVAVVTAPDKERGRGKNISFTPVKESALKNNIPVLQPEKMKDEKFVEELKLLNADLFIIVAFRILPPEVFTLPKFGAFNLHGSLLPRYRGAAPIQWALINGDSETGVTTFFLKEKVDTGAMILQEKIDILTEDNFGILHDKLMEIGANVVLQTVRLIETGNVITYSQDESLVTPAPKITKELCAIDWNKPANHVHNLIRGLSPHPGAFFIHNEKIFKIYSTSVVENNLMLGQIFQTKKELIIGTKEGSISILEIQPEGRKRMKIEEFLLGYKLA
ncbi:MAG: methionyl-tRNA formyltransferase [bacterium]